MSSKGISPPGAESSEKDIDDHSSSYHKSGAGDDTTTDGGDGTSVSTSKSKIDDTLDNESKCMKRSRIVILATLLVVGALAGGLTYYATSKQEEREFQDQASFYAFKIEEAVHIKAKNLVAVLDTMAVTVETYALTSSTEWPFQTFPFFESVVSQFRNVSSTNVITLAPMVSNTQTQDWEPYSVENQDWLQQSYQTMGWNVEPFPIQGAIYNIDDSGLVVASDSSRNMPLWQQSEPPKDTGVINYNLLSNEQITMTYQAFFDNPEHGQFGPVMDDQLLTTLGDAQLADPQTLFLQPILEQDQVVATLPASMAWNQFFSSLLHEEQDTQDTAGDGMVVVVSSSCQQDLVFTYQLSGADPVFLGMGDYHDPAYDDVVQYTHLLEIYDAKFDGQTQENSLVCDYFLAIYPSAAVEQQVSTDMPAIFAVVMTMLFVLAAVFFVVYDYFVQRQQREVMAELARSNAIVSSLFPAEIRDRLFNDDDDNNNNGGDAKDELAKAGVTSKDIEKAVQKAGGTAQKFRLKNYLDEEGDAAEKAAAAAAASKNVVLESKPIADLFPNTTVLFADIAGFTAWSSVREPSQVFTLLETIYKAFDKTAKRRKVFKVETVGDCYVAVTGLPEPVKDHPIIMCKFARECLTQFNTLATQLEVFLGPDTGDLNLRVGIHSGPVTAGVLRGDKSRFQLFGDTVNTAARIESSGLRNKIHLSHETAELLFAAGKSNWMARRTDTIVAKGKGEMQTYWLLTDEELAEGGALDSATNKASAPLPIVQALQPRLAKTTMNMLDPESSLPPRIKRLVDWNVDVLKRLLKQIVAKRNAEQKELYDLNHPVMMKHEMNIGSDTYVLAEVTEIIRLPNKVVKLEENPNKVVLPDGVEDQLRLYVSSIAAMHRDNPFHNFEHASHVMMSVSKLLSRIVAPDEVLQGDDEQDAIAASLHDHTYGITSDPLTQFSVVLAALIHDVDHAGVSNAQLIKEGAKIADVFKKKSVAEQNSIVLAWDRLMESRFAAFRNCIYADPDELKRFRQLMVNTVLATDIFDKELQTIRKNRWDIAFRKIDQETESTPEDDVNRKATIVIEHLIQASDVAHTMQHWHIYQKWNERLFAEMTHAYEHGRLGFNPAEGWYKGEIGFFDNYIIPLAKKLKECGVFGVSSDEYLNYAMENRREWASKGEETVKRLIEKYCKKEEEPAEEAKEEAGASGQQEAAPQPEGGGRMKRRGSSKA